MIQSVVSEFFMQEPQNLKEKRAILKRIVTRAKQKFNISIAETDYQDLWQRAEISFAIVSSSHIQAEKEVREVLAFLDSFPEWERAETVMEKL
ncbi:DUF503 domain-containing protein [Listeria monocytogenes]|uniref:YlxP-like protein n=1 Tax=Listeria monocytogenes serotype 4a (strain M7) TaxID=1030009 RepID=A0A0E0UVN9_LISMM|nr:DUF503 domain-containing protein [Listeria monocytogenes]ACK39591.1 YlxP [Listeria monocytogenes HCC23]AEH92416.1 hypothetical protein LMM7_1411 [Listeria monocytogenes M7]AKS53912.1 hypothetical protein LM850658_06575 [Listeria monocytogenes]EAC6860347.1 DUF503 domain-containing protein [Listeria monocytogenes]EAD0182979.1 DUF503 domain-containing protein [Listeria monocytogenes]